MCRGSFEHTIDAKGRLSVPSKFREVLLGKGDDRLVITNFAIGGQRCLDVYPFDEWTQLEEEIRKKPKFDPAMLVFQNYYFGGASECVLDKEGRILIPPLLRQHANLKRDVVLVSALEKFRIWDREVWKQVFTDSEGKLMEDPNFLATLGI